MGEAQVCLLEYRTVSERFFLAKTPKPTIHMTTVTNMPIPSISTITDTQLGCYRRMRGVCKCITKLARCQPCSRLPKLHQTPPALVVFWSRRLMFFSSLENGFPKGSKDRKTLNSIQETCHMHLIPQLDNIILVAKPYQF